MRKLFLVLVMLGMCSVSMAGMNDKISMDFRETDIREICKIIAAQAGMGLAIDRGVSCALTITLKDATIKEALDVTTQAADISWRLVGGTILISNARIFEGYEVRVVPLKHISTDEATKIVSMSIPGELKVSSCQQANSIVIAASPAVLKNCMKIIGHIDRPGKYVKASVKIFNGDRQIEKFDFYARSGVPCNILQRITHKARGKDKAIKAIATVISFEMFIESISNAGQMEAFVKFSLNKSNKNVSIESVRKHESRIAAEKGKPVQILATSGVDPVKVLFTWEE
ncbi:MAG: hypothetical protein A2W80_08935 [Candidatus Riflebacteria bacterium GWC2_50_8]|nr:MAG: hypothetical protein A2W80_08935 [Candidatus Riflebacteria bacterium GWC2_50_8]